jgi:hypothetical protein
LDHRLYLALGRIVTIDPVATSEANVWVVLGLVVGLTGTRGSFMVSMIALGVIYMGMGARTKRNSPK